MFLLQNMYIFQMYLILLRVIVKVQGTGLVKIFSTIGAQASNLHERFRYAAFLHCGNHSSKSKWSGYSTQGKTEREIDIHATFYGGQVPYLVHRKTNEEVISITGRERTIAWFCRTSFLDKSPESTDIDMTVLTKEETELISDSWDLVAQDLPGHALKFFKQ